MHQPIPLPIAVIGQNHLSKHPDVPMYPAMVCDKKEYQDLVVNSGYLGYKLVDRDTITKVVDMWLRRIFPSMR